MTVIPKGISRKTTDRPRSDHKGPLIQFNELVPARRNKQRNNNRSLV